MKVVMTAVMAGPEGTARPGTVLDLPADKAKQLIEGRCAREYDPATDASAKRHGLTKPPVSFTNGQ